MKKINIIIVLLVYTLSVIADPVNIETAKKVAKNYMDDKIPNRTNTIKSLFNETYNGEIVYYVVNFEEGGWVMVSADDNTVPVLGFSFEGTALKNTAKPPAYEAWVNNYKEQVFNARSLKERSQEVKDKWDNLINPLKLKSLQYNYTPGTPLLDVPGRGEVQWGQTRNNDGGCSPSYNEFCPDRDCDDACHDRASAGCGAVALGQIMWYWQWPDNSSYRSYDWTLMPNVLLNSSSNAEGDEIAHLLRDIGDASNMHYWCAGAWATTDNLVDALKKFKYKKAEKKVRSHFNFGDVWGDLLRAEVDAGRPVLYKGGNVVDLDDLPDELGAVHYFVLDGYSASDPDYFHFNFGWPHKDCNLSYHYISDLTPDDDGTDEYNKHQRAIIGISPTCSEAPYNINDVDYSTVTDFKHEQARHNITLPANGESLTVEEGGKLILTAGNSIRLTSGMSAEPGSYFRADIRDLSFSQSGINVTFWPEGFTPNGDGFNDELCYEVHNANTWEFHAFNSSDQIIFQSTGTITEHTCCVWDGTNACSPCNYRCIIRFRNSCGEMLGNEHMVNVFVGSNKKSVLTNKTKSIKNKDGITTLNEPTINIYPNPTNGLFIIKLQNTQLPVNIEVQNIEGIVLYNQQHNSHIVEIDLVGYSKGIYLVKIISDDQCFHKKVIVQ